MGTAGGSFTRQSTQNGRGGGRTLGTGNQKQRQRTKGNVHHASACSAAAANTRERNLPLLCSTSMDAAESGRRRLAPFHHCHVHFHSSHYPAEAGRQAHQGDNRCGYHALSAISARRISNARRRQTGREKHQASFQHSPYHLQLCRTTGLHRKESHQEGRPAKAHAPSRGSTHAGTGKALLSSVSQMQA